MDRPRIAFVSREVHPLVSGGIGVRISAQATLLAGTADVTVFTRAAVADRYRELVAAGHSSLPAGVAFVFVDEPDPRAGDRWDGYFHQWSGNVLRAIVETYPDGGPDLVEFPDFCGEAAVAVQARRAGDPALWRTTVAVRLCTSHEQCAVLNGMLPSDLANRNVHALERYALRHADRLLYPAREVLASYERFYGPAALAPAVRGPRPVRLPAVAVGPPPPADDPLRLLYLGRLERRKGVHVLVRALTGLAEDGWTLTLVGNDTQTGPHGTSMRAHLLAMTAGDERFDFRAAVSREKLVGIINAHHAVVVPSLWEAVPNVGLEALACGRPVIATPTGGLLELAGGRPGGWGDAGLVLQDSSADAITAAVRALVGDRDPLVARILDGRPRRRLDRLAADGDALRFYASAARRPRDDEVPSSSPAVSVVIAYNGQDAAVVRAVAAALEQRTVSEVVVVNDGWWRPRDAVLEGIADEPRVRVVHQPRSGPGQARTFGARLCRGRFVVIVDADTVLAPSFTERCLAALDLHPEAAWATSWVAYDDGAEDHPLTDPAAGVALFRRSALEAWLPLDPDLSVPERLLLDARPGVVVPAVLVDMVRGADDPDEARDARAREVATRWMATVQPAPSPGDPRSGRAGSAPGDG